MIEILLFIVLVGIFIGTHPIFTKSIYNYIYLAFLLAILWTIIFDGVYYEISSTVMIVLILLASIPIIDKKTRKSTRNSS